MKATLLLLLALTLPCASRAAQTENYVAHEWGTFTSVQGADGTLIPWNPGIATDLPTFVYNRNRPWPDGEKGQPVLFLTKGVSSALHRMETPVIYFYSDQSRKVNVKVNFPEGTVTEWYPKAAAFGPTGVTPKSLIDWGEVHIVGAEEATRAPKLPTEPGKNHYYAARETDANLVRIGGGKGSPDEWEKYLFYRGLGQFAAPLQVALTDDGRITLINNSPGTLKHLYILNLRDGKGSITYHPALPVNSGSPTIKPNPPTLPMKDIVQQMNQRMSESLQKEGLYTREAQAMVKTWHDSWFEESGLRVLYVIPSQVADSLLPLTLTPAPKELVRVFVGRSEIITQNVEWELLQQIVRFGENDAAVKNAALEKTRDLELGRFANAAVTRLLGPKPSPEFRAQAHALLNALNAPGPVSVTAIR